MLIHEHGSKVIQIYRDQLAEAAEPLRELLSTKTTWIWTIEHDIAFKKVKDILVKHTTFVF